MIQLQLIEIFIFLIKVNLQRGVKGKNHIGILLIIIKNQPCLIASEAALIQS